MEIEKKEFKFDTNAVMFMIYLLWKCNMLTRHNLKAILEEVKKPAPEDVIKYLVQEAGRAT
jgi:hypothetical protein